MLWFFLLFSTGCWGIAEIFYKKGNVADEPYAHLKTTVFVGVFFGVYSLVILLTQDVEIAYLPANFIRYLPVALCYIVSMVCSYYGVRYIEESISDPIENTSCAFVPVLCAVFMHQHLNAKTVIAIVVVAIGILCIGFFDTEGKANRKKLFGKKLALVSIAMPFCYMILDAIGTFLDIYYTDDAATSVLVGVTEDNLEHTANCCYEFTFLLIAVGILIYLKTKGVKLFSTAEDEALVAAGEPVPQKSLLQKIGGQRNKILAALFETGGQATYLFALSEGSGVAAVILGSGTVIISFILSRFLLKEKLTVLQYVFIGIVFIGIISLSLLEA
ncbi:MAG: EamA family transporter [Clostridia bacterium]|nr:EamA family transporter [Clostridia bacterium]